MLSLTTDVLRSTPAANGATSCLHCGNALPAAAQDEYCCSGCRAVRSLLLSSGLSRYYALRGASIEPATDADQARRDHTWLEPIASALADSDKPQVLTFKLQGVRCAACVWLVQELFEREPGSMRVVVNPGRGVAELCVAPTFPLQHFVTEVERFGYALGELGSQQADDDSDGLLVRTGVCMALGGNAMMFAAAIYLGLEAGPVYRLMHTLNFACATLAVLIGGPVFFRSAWQALQRRILHLDLPIAVGIALTYGAALWSFGTGNARAAYYDSLATFIGLMLLGRYLKQRMVARNRRELLCDSGAENLWVRRVQGEQVDLLRAPHVRAGDILLVPSGDLLVAPAELLDTAASCSLDWINGESEPQDYARGATLPAGAFNVGTGALRARALTDFAQSPLSDLLARTRNEELDAPKRYSLFSGIYVAGVLLAAGGGFLWFWLSSGDAIRGLEVATAICVVTCPCAIGIATPLAYDMVLAGLRRAGLFVRSQSFLDRALDVRRIVFDKTGTLTTGRLELVDASALSQLPQADRNALYTLVAGSAHPKSQAVQRALAEDGTALCGDAVVTEQPGDGLLASIDGHDYRLGHGKFACKQATSDDLVFARDGVALCTLQTRERLRSDARSEVAALTRAGYQTWVLSGDAQARVSKLAAELGVPAERAIGDQSPSGKADWITAHDRNDILMLGDGINDGLSVQRAFASGTPSIDRALMPWRTDFYFTTSGLAPIGLALRAAKHLSRVVFGNQVFAVTYNAATVAVALAGLMKPWMAAVLMPLSSLLVLGATTLALSSRSRLWRS
jgi:P-type Cu2+ transporter